MNDGCLKSQKGGIPLKKRVFIITSVVLISICVLVWGWPGEKGFGVNRSKLSAEEAESIVLANYDGEIVSTKKMKDRYDITLKSSTGLYAVGVDADDGEIQSIARLEAAAPENGQQSDREEDRSNHGPKPDQVSPTQPNDQQHPTQPIFISEEEAAKTALEHVNGEVDDVEIHIQDGQAYYLVEIETNDERDEATVQVHAITGEVMSITWDD